MDYYSNLRKIERKRAEASGNKERSTDTPSFLCVLGGSENTNFTKTIAGQYRRLNIFDKEFVDRYCRCSAQTRNGIGLLEKPPAEKRFPAVESHLGVRASYATRRKRRYEADKCG